MYSNSSKKAVNPLTTSQASTGLWVIFIILILLFSVVVGLYIFDRNNKRAEEQGILSEAEVLQQQINDLQKDVNTLKKQ